MTKINLIFNDFLLVNDGSFQMFWQKMSGICKMIFQNISIVYLFNCFKWTQLFRFDSRFDPGTEWRIGSFCSILKGAQILIGCLVRDEMVLWIMILEVLSIGLEDTRYGFRMVFDGMARQLMIMFQFKFDHRFDDIYNKSIRLCFQINIIFIRFYIQNGSIYCWLFNSVIISTNFFSSKQFY